MPTKCVFCFISFSVAHVCVRPSCFSRAVLSACHFVGHRTLRLRASPLPLCAQARLPAATRCRHRCIILFRFVPNPTRLRSAFHHDSFGGARFRGPLPVCRVVDAFVPSLRFVMAAASMYYIVRANRCELTLSIGWHTFFLFDDSKVCDSLLSRQ